MPYDLKNKTLAETQKIYKGLSPEEKESFLLELNDIFKPALDAAQKGFERIQEMGRVLSRAIAEFGKRTHTSFAYLKQHGWIISGEIPITHIDLSGIDIEQQQRILLDYFDTLFSEKNYELLSLMLRRWRANPFMSKRMHILSDCIDLYKASSNKKSYYTVIIPTILTQIDGLLWDYLQLLSPHEPVLDQLFRELSSAHRTRKAKIQSELQKEARKKIKTSGLNTYADDMYSNLINDILFESLYHGEKPQSFNRHKILHGENLTYDKKEYAMKLFLIVDFICDLVDDLN